MITRSKPIMLYCHRGRDAREYITHLSRTLDIYLGGGERRGGYSTSPNRYIKYAENRNIHACIYTAIIYYN